MEASLVSEISAKLTAFSLIVIESNLVYWLVSIFSPRFTQTLTMVPIYVMEYFEPWRFLTSAFVSTSFLSMLIILPAYLSISCLTERRLGSVKYCLFFLSNIILLQILSIFLIWLFRFDSKQPLQVLFGQILIEVIVSSRKNPDSPVNFLCCPGKIKSEYYPYAVFFLGFLLGMYTEMLSGVIIGLINTKISLANLHRPTIESLENSVACACFQVFSKFVPISQSIEEELPFTFVHADNSPPRQPPPRNYERFESFEDDSL